MARSATPSTIAATSPPSATPGANSETTMRLRLSQRSVTTPAGSETTAAAALFAAQTPDMRTGSLVIVSAKRGKATIPTKPSPVDDIAVADQSCQKRAGKPLFARACCTRPPLLPLLTQTHLSNFPFCPASVAKCPRLKKNRHNRRVASSLSVHLPGRLVGEAGQRVVEAVIWSEREGKENRTGPS